MNLTVLQDRSFELGLSLPVVACEFLQILFLDRFYANKESNKVYFHGGTSLRLLHGGYRFSEDLDFASSKLSPSQLKDLVDASAKDYKKLVIQYWGPVSVELKIIHDKFPVLSWWLNVSHPDYRGKFKVKIEIGHFPVYRPRVTSLRPGELDVGFFPLIPSQELSETWADKINALAQRPFLKGRDLFDLWFMKEVLRPERDLSLVAKKFKDYKTKTPRDALLKVTKEIPKLDLASEMNRFLPRKYREKLSTDDYHLIKKAAKENVHYVLEGLPWR